MAVHFFGICRYLGSPAPPSPAHCIFPASRAGFFEYSIASDAFAFRSLRRRRRRGISCRIRLTILDSMLHF